MKDEIKQLGEEMEILGIKKELDGIVEQLKPLADILNKFDTPVKETILATVIEYLLKQVDVSDQFRIASLELLKHDILG